MLTAMVCSGTGQSRRMNEKWMCRDRSTTRLGSHGRLHPSVSCTVTSTTCRGRSSAIPEHSRRQTTRRIERPPRGRTAILACRTLHSRNMTRLPSTTRPVFGLRKGLETKLGSTVRLPTLSRWRPLKATRLTAESGGSNRTLSPLRCVRRKQRIRDALPLWDRHHQHQARSLQRRLRLSLLYLLGCSRRRHHQSLRNRLVLALQCLRQGFPFPAPTV
mmetsp:Transcript_17206/g.50832  ORF Transcript_17206/g.50832 Transcript_17206/m.50832 type:complete len:217 (+) Transcript_17206:1942-2592(+)